MIRARARADAGFSVIETLVATLVVAAVTGMTYETVIVQARATRMAEQRRLALMVAQSVLDAGSGPDVGAVTASRGVQGDIVWTLDRQPYRNNARSGGPALDLVTVRAGRAGEPPAVTLSTLRLEH